MSPAAVVLLACAALAACGGAAPAGPRNLILISIDTLRADRLGCMGYERDTSPALDRLAADGIAFRAVTESSWTLPAHVTLLSGVAPAAHGVVKPALRIRDDTQLLAERLRAAGFRTIGLTGGVFVSRRHGFERGFDVFEDETKPGLESTLAKARTFLERFDGERTFLFLHTYDVHCPYDPSAEFAQRFASPDAEFIETAGRCGNPDFNALALTAGQARHLSDRYDASIREADAQLGEFFDWLRDRGAFADTLVIVTSDHGESFLEHGQIGHERTVYREVLEVPLLVSGAGVEARGMAGRARLADVVPTALALLGVAGDGFDGDALLEAPRGNQAPPFYSEASWPVELRALTTDTHRLILDLASGRVELFAGDGLDVNDISASDVARARELEAELRDYLAAHPTRSAPTITPLTEDERDELRALGYL